MEVTEVGNCHFTNVPYAVDIHFSLPIFRHNDELVQFLRVHRGSNFVKTHGGDINKYVESALLVTSLNNY